MRFFSRVEESRFFFTTRPFLLVNGHILFFWQIITFSTGEIKKLILDFLLIYGRTLGSRKKARLLIFLEIFSPDDFVMRFCRTLYKFKRASSQFVFTWRVPLCKYLFFYNHVCELFLPSPNFFFFFVENLRQCFSSCRKCAKVCFFRDKKKVMHYFRWKKKNPNKRAFFRKRGQNVSIWLKILWYDAERINKDFGLFA